MTEELKRLLERSPADISGAELTQLVKADRLARRLNWKDYAVAVGVPFMTIYKIGTGKTSRPHLNTVDQVMTAIKGTGAGRVVSD